MAPAAPNPGSGTPRNWAATNSWNRSAKAVWSGLSRDRSGDRPDRGDQDHGDQRRSRGEPLSQAELRQR